MKRIESISFTYLQQTAQNFLNRNSMGGLLLALATLLALGLANSPFRDLYNHFWGMEVEIANMHFRFHETIVDWVNDGLMVIFFLVASLELKRALWAGELSTFRTSALPLIAAVGGMLVPALIYLLFNTGTDMARGWGIPMATDIAYSLGVLSLLRNRVPHSLKVFLIALAIIDDIGGILVITLFYSSDLSWIHLAIGGGFWIALLVINQLGIRAIPIYLLLGFGLWLALLDSGIHPTLAGVLLAFSIPIKGKLDGRLFNERIERRLSDLKQIYQTEDNPLTNENQRKIIEQIEQDTFDHRSPLLLLENRLTPVNEFFILPIFAIANAGVTFGDQWYQVFTQPLGLGIMLGLIVGKFTGVLSFSYLGVKMGLGKLPQHVNWKGLAGVGAIAGMGFTMSLFITQLAFFDSGSIQLAKISILLASLIAAILGLSIFAALGRKGKANTNNT